MEAVCVLLQQKPDWITAKVVLSNVNIVNELRTFDKDNIVRVATVVNKQLKCDSRVQSSAVLKKLRVYTADPMLSVDSMRSVSTAATGLALWVHAMDLYSKVR